MKPDPIKDSRQAWSEIDLSALAYNLGVIKSFRAGPDTKIMAVVKADAYGHGAVEVSRHVIKNGADALGVAFVEEGLLLRNEGIDSPIHILGECPPAAAVHAIGNNMILTVNSIDSARSYSEIAAKMGREAKININIDTGMNRLGISWRNIKAVPEILSLKNICTEGISSHFSCASEKDAGFTELQLERFSSVLGWLGSSGITLKNIHMANSGAFFRFKQSNFDMARMGIALYGLNPYNRGWERWLPGRVKEAIRNLKPVLSFKSRISFIKKVPAGEPISYCRTFKTQRDSIIATIPVGYADGYSRMLSNRAKVLIKGMEAPVVGNITMDQFMVDITDISSQNAIHTGDEAVLLGKSGSKTISAEHIADILGTINYEVTCMLKPRVPRIYI